MENNFHQASDAQKTTKCLFQNFNQLWWKLKGGDGRQRYIRDKNDFFLIKIYESQLDNDMGQKRREAI